jgi:hypothetical protein
MKFLRILNWSVYLGCSWTWCIGMFLPVILVSEFGNIAWLLFAIPNVLGAAAMGWTLAKPGASLHIVANHRTACVAFTAVTLAFHVFFLYWLGSVRMIPYTFSITAMVAGVVLGLAGRWLKGWDWALPWIVLGISLLVLGKGLEHPIFGVADPLKPVPVPTAMLGLAPVCLFGFLLCPYLDVTFHRARQQTSPGAGKAAFAIGFGVVFLLMIVLTLMYTGDFALDRSVDDRFGSFGGALLITWVAFHIASQIGFTFAAHLRALPPPRRRDVFIWIGAGLLALIAIVALRQQRWFSLPVIQSHQPLARAINKLAQLHISMLNGNLIYRLFMSFYGLIFPGYVWICMVPLRGKSPGPSRLALTALAISVAIAAPMFWMGFINEWMLWLIPGVAVVLLARVFVLKSAAGGLADAATQISKI